MILYKAEKKFIAELLSFYKENGRYPTNAEMHKRMNKERSNISIYIRRLKKFLNHKKKYASPIEIKPEYKNFFSLPDKKQDQIILEAIRDVDNSV